MRATELSGAITYRVRTRPGNVLNARRAAEVSVALIRYWGEASPSVVVETEASGS